MTTYMPPTMKGAAASRTVVARGRTTALRRSLRMITGGAANAPRISLMSPIIARYVMMVTLIYAPSATLTPGGAGGGRIGPPL